MCKIIVEAQGGETRYKIKTKRPPAKPKNLRAEVKGQNVSISWEDPHSKKRLK